eukprot:101559-Amorphochlora_amoeboformis.AAC.1
MAGMGLRGLGSVREGGAEEDDWSGVLYGGMELMLWLFLGLIGLAYCHMGYMWLRVKLTSGEGEEKEMELPEIFIFIFIYRISFKI